MVLQGLNACFVWETIKKEVYIPRPHVTHQLSHFPSDIVVLNYNAEFFALYMMMSEYGTWLECQSNSIGIPDMERRGI